jgi:hypothetical protein
MHDRITSGLNIHINHINFDLQMIPGSQWGELPQPALEFDEEINDNGNEYLTKEKASTFNSRWNSGSKRTEWETVKCQEYESQNEEYSHKIKVN